jgi:predicted Fe-S protein YdhL (DUF1289 family)
MWGRMKEGVCVSCVKSKEEAIEWGKAAQFDETEVQDFGADFTPELREQEKRLRTQIEKPKIP